MLFWIGPELKQNVPTTSKFRVILVLKRLIKILEQFYKPPVIITKLWKNDATLKLPNTCKNEFSHQRPN